MMRRRCYLLTILVFAGPVLWAVAQPTAEELEQNRRKLDAIRKNAEQLANLRENLQQFQALSQKRQDKIVQLDHDLHEFPAAKQVRYFNVLERYADWLDQLRQSDPRVYQAIKNAPDAAVRLALIKDQRDREWMQTQPKAYREQWDKLQGEPRTAFVAKLRLDERQKHQQWVIAQRFWKELEAKKEMPSQLSDFSEKVKTYVKEFLLPKLTDAEKNQLKSAEGRWPDYPVALVEMASKRPTALPPLRIEELPRRLRRLARSDPQAT